MIFNEVIYVAANWGYVLLGVILTLIVLHIIVGIATAVLEKMTERKKAELEELLRQAREKGYEDAE